MKKCPVCHTEYDDSLNFCTKDGNQLVEAVVKPEPPKPDKPARRRGGGCMKKILVAVVIAVIGLAAIYHHLMNAATYLRTEPCEIAVTKGGGECRIDIDYDGYVWLVNHKPEWVSIDEHDDNFDLRVGPNATGQRREGSITVQSGKHLAQVVVRQNAFAMVIRPSAASAKFGKSGGHEEIAIETDGCEWEAEYTDWMTVRKRDDGKLRIDCPSNDGDYRTGTIVVSEDNARATIKVTQAGKCNVCHGSGTISCNACMGIGHTGFGFYSVNCVWCGGQGTSVCSTCGGSGFRE